MTAQLKTIITADAVCAISPELMLPKIPLIRSKLRTKDGEFIEGEEIMTQNILEYSRRFHCPPELIMPTVDEYRGFFNANIRPGATLCHFSASSRHGVAFSRAIEAALSIPGVYVIDTQQVGSGFVFPLMQGIRLANEGFAPPFIAKATAELLPHIASSYASSSTEFLEYCGRVSHNITAGMDFLSLAPTILIKNGTARGKCVGCGKGEYWRNYIARTFRKRKNIEKQTLILSCSPMNKINSRKFISEIERYVHFNKIVVTDITANFCCRLGEDAIGLHFIVD